MRAEDCFQTSSAGFPPDVSLPSTFHKSRGKAECTAGWVYVFPKSSLISSEEIKRPQDAILIIIFFISCFFCNLLSVLGREQHANTIVYHCKGEIKAVCCTKTTSNTKCKQENNQAS